MRKKAYIFNTILSFFLIIIFFTIFLTSLTYPRTNIHHYNIINEWGEREGLPSNNINAITQTTCGYLWLATNEGLVRFNGVKFFIFNSSNIPQFRTNRITCLLADKDGSLWIGTEGGGLLHYQNNKFKLYTTENGLISNYVTVIFKDSTGNIWIGTPDNGLCSYKNNIFTKYDSDSGLTNTRISALFEDDTGALWVGTFGGLYILKNDKLEKIKIDNSFNEAIISEIYQDRKGLIWIGSNKGLFIIKNNQVLNIIGMDNGLTNQWINSINSDRWGNIWVGSHDGLQIIYPDQNNRYKIETILENFPVTDIMNDPEHSIWIATIGKGIKMFRAGKFISYTQQEGLSHNVPLSLFEDAEKKIWISFANGDINLYNAAKNNFSLILKEKINSSESIRVMCQDNNGNIWIGSYGGGLYKYESSGRVKRFSKSDGLISDLVRTVFSDSNGNLWIGTRFGLSIFVEEKFINYTTEQGLPSNIILCINEDNEGKIWIGTGKGLAYFINKRFETFLLNSNISSLPILSIVPDSSGVLWVGTEGGGLIRVKDQSPSYINISNGLPSNIIANILEDSQNDIWLTTDKGIIQTTKKDLSLIFDKQKKKLDYKYYDTSDGLPSSECVKYSQYSVLKSSDGLLWFTTMGGLGMIDPQNILINKTPPKIVVEGITVDENKIISATNEMVLSPKNSVSIYFVALSFISPHKIKFRYKLENYDKDWTEIQPGKDRRVTYRKLKTGRYAFLITACNSDGVWNPQHEAVYLNIIKPFTQTSMFYLLLTLTIIFLGSSIYFLKVKKLIATPSKKYKSSTLSPEKKDEYLKKIIEVLEKDKIFMEENITLRKLSKTLSIPTHHLSQVINEKLQKNFNDLINSNRIEEAKRKLLESDAHETSILEIAYEVGFNSKSVFNRAFKKYTGMTPSQFRKKTQENKTNKNSNFNG